jgi:hypothetical protein
MTKKELETAFAALQAQAAVTAAAVKPAAVKPTGLNKDGKPVWQEFHVIRLSPTLEIRASFKLGMGGSVQSVRTGPDGIPVRYSFGRSVVKFRELGALGTPMSLISALVSVAEAGEATCGTAAWTNKRA